MLRHQLDVAMLELAIRRLIFDPEIGQLEVAVDDRQSVGGGERGDIVDVVFLT
jgi:hypothetical protein